MACHLTVPSNFSNKYWYMYTVHMIPRNTPKCLSGGNDLDANNRMTTPLYLSFKFQTQGYINDWVMTDLPSTSNRAMPTKNEKNKLMGVWDIKIGANFQNNIFKCIFVFDNGCIVIQISL